MVMLIPKTSAACWTRCDKIDCWAIQHWTHQAHKSADLIKTSPNVKRHLYHLKNQFFVFMLSWGIHWERQPSMHDIIIESKERRKDKCFINWRTQLCEKAGRVYLIYPWLIGAGVLAQFWRLKIATCLISLIWGWPIASSIYGTLRGWGGRGPERGGGWGRCSYKSNCNHTTSLILR